MKLALIVEGEGDVKSFPNLISRTAALFGEHAVVPHPIRAGAAAKLIRDGEIEKWARLASSQEGIQKVIVAVDLDDGCPVTWRRILQERCDAVMAETSVPISVVFCVREYECWFLGQADHLAVQVPELAWRGMPSPDNPEGIRGAKERLQGLMLRHYKEVIHQLTLTQKLDLSALYRQSRSYRCLVKAVSGVDYDILDAIV